MKPNHPFSKALAPLTGSICGVILLSALTLSGKEPWAGRPSLIAPPDRPSVPNVTEARSADAATKAGLDYLLKQQQPDGGWGQGGGWRQNLQKGSGRVEDAKGEDPSDLGNTCVALVTLIRAGHSPKTGEHRDAASKAFDFICRVIEKADAESLYVTPVRDTQLQVKIGTYVDTFLAGWVLSEVKDHLPDEAAETRRAAVLEKVVRKIEKHQGTDGAFAGNNGWAAVLSQGLASKALNGAARSGAKVSQSTLDKDAAQNNAGLDRNTGSFSAPATAAEPSSAGVSLYRETSKLGGLWEKARSNAKPKAEAEKTLADADAPAPAKKQAEQQLKKFADDEKTARDASAAIAGKANDAHFTAGFGNNGGEEYLSYMNLAESLRAQGGQEWTNWRAKMLPTVSAAQNADGSWAGLHCITGRTFCTSTALLTLLVDQNSDGAKTSAISTPDATATAAK